MKNFHRISNKQHGSMKSGALRFSGCNGKTSTV